MFFPIYLLPMFETDRLLTLIDAYCQDTSTSNAAFGKKVLGNPNFVYDLRNGVHSPRLATLNKIVLFLSDAGYN